jgi:hypothetical protein
VCFDCGEQAAGMRTDAVPNSMHGHADCLSIIVTLRGQRVLVDSGLYAYNCGGAWEAHFRETAAHNTAKVDGRDQARHLNKMAWSDSYRATLERWSPQPDQAWVVGSHDGYARGRDGIVHRRAVWLRPDSYVLIYDEFVGSGEHDITVNYQFAPGELTTLGTDAVLFDNAVDLIWLSRDSWSADISSGGAGPDDGWIAPSLGVKQAAPRLRLTGRTSRPRTSLLTVIAARATPRARVHVAASEAWGTLAAVTTGNGVDVVAAQGISGGQAIDSDALLAVCGIGADGSLVTTSMDASRLSVDAEMLCSLAASHRRFSEPSRAHTTPQRSPTTVVTP